MGIRAFGKSAVIRGSGIATAAAVSVGPPVAEGADIRLRVALPVRDGGVGLGAAGGRRIVA